MSSSRTVLWGADHPEAGAAEIRGVAEGVAVGLARGWRPKPYWYLDPNEDAVAAVVGPRATLLVVADGHHGIEASHAAVASVLDQLGDHPPPADLTDPQLVGIVDEAGAAVLAATADLARPRCDSRTTLTVVLMAGRRLQWAGVGDSSLFVVADHGAVELTVPEHAFLAGPLTRRQATDSCVRGTVEIDEDAWVVVATDGYTNWLPAPATPAEATRVYLRGHTEAVEAVEALLDRARAGGAGDNVALAVVAPQARPVGKARS